MREIDKLEKRIDKLEKRSGEFDQMHVNCISAQVQRENKLDVCIAAAIDCIDTYKNSDLFDRLTRLEKKEQAPMFVPCQTCKKRSRPECSMCNPAVDYEPEEPKPTQHFKVGDRVRCRGIGGVWVIEELHDIGTEPEATILHPDHPSIVRPLSWLRLAEESKFNEGDLIEQVTSLFPNRYHRVIDPIPNKDGEILVESPPNPMGSRIKESTCVLIERKPKFKPGDRVTLKCTVMGTCSDGDINIEFDGKINEEPRQQAFVSPSDCELIEEEQEQVIPAGTYHCNGCDTTWNVPTDVHGCLVECVICDSKDFHKVEDTPDGDGCPPQTTCQLIGKPYDPIQCAKCWRQHATAEEAVGRDSHCLWYDGNGLCSYFDAKTGIKVSHKCKAQPSPAVLDANGTELQVGDDIEIVAFGNSDYGRRYTVTALFPANDRISVKGATARGGQMMIMSSNCGMSYMI